MMGRRISAEGLQLLKQWEGLRLQAYQDGGGTWTIGYGSTSGVQEGQVITAAEAQKRLQVDVGAAERAVDTLVTVPLTDNQFAALVSFVYNVGREAFAKSTLLKRLNKEDYASVPMELAKWTKVRRDGKLRPDVGLANRRAAEAGLWAKGAFVTSRETEVAQPASEMSQRAWLASVAALVTAIVPLTQGLVGLTWPAAATLVGGALILAGFLALRRH